MKDNKMTEAMNYIDYDLIMEADIQPIVPKAIKHVRLRLSLAFVCVLLACMLLIAVPFLNVGGTVNEWLPLPPTAPDTSTIPVDTYTETPDTDIITPPYSDTTPTPTIIEPTPEIIIEHLSLDINPSIDFTVENGIVTKCIGINDDGKELLGTVNVEGLEIEIAFPIVLEKLIERGYISSSDISVMLLSAYGSENTEELLKLAEELASGILGQHRLTAYIISQKINYDMNTERIANAYGVSLGKMQYILNFLEKSDNVTFDSISKLSSTPLYVLLGFDITQKFYNFIHVTDGYNEYGEKILMVRDNQGQSICIEWDKLSKAEQKEIYRYYKPSFTENN